MSVTEIKKPIKKSVLDVLELLLEQAKTGEITEVIVLYDKSDEFEITYSWSDDLPRVISALEILKHRHIKRMFE